MNTRTYKERFAGAAMALAVLTGGLVAIPTAAEAGVRICKTKTPTIAFTSTHIVGSARTTCVGTHASPVQTQIRIRERVGFPGYYRWVTRNPNYRANGALGANLRLRMQPGRFRIEARHRQGNQMWKGWNQSVAMGRQD